MELYAFLLTLSPLLAGVQGNSEPLCQIGEEIDVLWGGYWFPATVLDANDKECLIQYDGYGAEDNEWVGLDRIRFIEKEYELEAGTAVEVLWKGKWFRATVLKSRGAHYFIRYEGWSSQWDEWVGPDRLRKLP
ncbi:MAG: hypothetical protein IH820_13745 [Bacteroidetes bacterium]|nr:hypothetical protein [Bacteroidota bacterium]